ncbi:hypothetical protein CEXT_173161 [Caerostris extrusa]|uniref:Uncharacterized protein n=1 Tax=Caerostris extrusa TaxID=172846 RepID=A0AAV4P4Y0_CAEEX|nr:hypothetical protein CEXT_173161 [Caerostris extrusa]
MLKTEDVLDARGSHSRDGGRRFEEAPSPMAEGEPQQLNTRTEAPLWHQGRLALCQNSTFLVSECRTWDNNGVWTFLSELGLGHSEKSFLLFGKIKVISSFGILENEIRMFNFADCMGFNHFLHTRLYGDCRKICKEASYFQSVWWNFPDISNEKQIRANADEERFVKAGTAEAFQEEDMKWNSANNCSPDESHNTLD